MQSCKAVFALSLRVRSFHCFESLVKISMMQSALEGMSVREVEHCMERYAAASSSEQSFLVNVPSSSSSSSSDGAHKNPTSVDVDVNIDVDSELAACKERMDVASSRLVKAQAQRAATHKKRRELTKLREALYGRANELEVAVVNIETEIESLTQENRQTAIQLERYLKINVLNDAFYIWYSGPYATINNFRLGSLSIKVVDWLEINTALGQAALALSVVAQRLPKEKFLFTKYMMYPLGSQSKVYKVNAAMIKTMYHSSVNKRMSAVHRQVTGNSLGIDAKHTGNGLVGRGAGEYNVADGAASRSNYNYNYHFDRHNADHFPQYTQTHGVAKNGGVHMNSSVYSGSLASGVAGDNPGASPPTLIFPVHPVPAEAVLLNLFMDPNQTFSLFPRSRFNAALYGLFCCIYELGEYVQRHDPPLAMPYKVDIGDESGRTCTISDTNPMNPAASEPLDLLWHGSTPTPLSSGGGGGSLLGGTATIQANSADEKWTRALKFALADIKWIIAWSTKHFVNDGSQS